MSLIFKGWTRFYGDSLRWHTLGDYSDGHCHLYTGTGHNNLGQNQKVFILIDLGVRRLLPDGKNLRPKQIFPDVRPYIQDLSGIFLTHGHEDHIGGLSHLMHLCLQQRIPIPPIYGSSVTLTVLKQHLNRLGISDDTAGKYIFPIEAGQTLSIGGLITIKAIPAPHSFAHSLSYFIAVAPQQGETKPAATAFHSGDCKVDPTLPLGSRLDLNLMSDICEQSGHGKKGKGVDALVMDSTNAQIPGFVPEENHVQNSLIEIATAFKTRCLAFRIPSGNHQRLASILIIAKKLRRRIMIAGPRLNSLFKEIDVLNNLATKLRVSIEDFDAASIQNKNPKDYFLISPHHADDLIKILCRSPYKFSSINPDNFLFINSTGLAFDSDPNFTHLQGKGLFYLNGYAYPVHSPGHGSQKDKKAYRDILSPRIVLPVHGFNDEDLNIHAAIAEAEGRTAFVARTAGMGAEFSFGRMSHIEPLRAAWIGTPSSTNKDYIFGLDGEGLSIGADVISLGNRNQSSRSSDRNRKLRLG